MTVVRTLIALALSFVLAGCSVIAPRPTTPEVRQMMFGSVLYALPTH